MKKQIIATILAASMAGAALAGCGSSSSDSLSQTVSSSAAETTEAAASEASTAAAETAAIESSDKPYDGATVTFWMQSYGTDTANQQNLMDSLVEDFKEKTGITVTYSIVDWSSANQKYTLACTGGEAPDCADMFFTNSFHQMSTDDYGIIPVDDLVEELGEEDAFYDAGKAECYTDGHWYGIPWRFDTRVLLYNTKDFENAGLEVPTTWDDFVKAAQALTTTDDSGNITHAGLAWYNDMGRYDQTWFTLLAGCGGSMMNDDFTEFTFDSDEGRESLQFLSDLINKDNICQNSLDSSYNAINEFCAGNTSMVWGVTGETPNSILNANPDMEGKYASAVLPSKDGTGASSISFSAPICIYKTAANMDATKEWVRYFCSTDVQVQVSEALSLLNSSKEVMQNPYFTDNAWLATFVDQGERAVPGDMPLTTWSQLDSFPDGPICTMCSKAVNGDNIDDAIAECMQEINEIGY